MKKYLVILMHIIFSLITNAQTSMLASYNLNQTQINYTLSIKKDVKRHSFVAGIKIIDKQDSVKQQRSCIFKHKFYPVNFKESIGFHLSYIYSFNFQNSAINPFIFYDLQLTRASFINNEYTTFLVDGGGVAGVFFDDSIYGICTVYENNIGIGFTAKVYKNISFFNRYGAGLALYRNIDSPGLMITNNKTWEISLMYNFGLMYKINYKNEN